MIEDVELDLGHLVFGVVLVLELVVWDSVVIALERLVLGVVTSLELLVRDSVVIVLELLPDDYWIWRMLTWLL